MSAAGDRDPREDEAAAVAAEDVEMAQPVLPPLEEPEGPEVSKGAKRELEDKDLDEQKAKQMRTWMDSPSKAVISDCLMVWTDDKRLLSPEESLGLQKGAYVATQNMEPMWLHTRCYTNNYKHVMSLRIHVMDLKIQTPPNILCMLMI